MQQDGGVVAVSRNKASYCSGDEAKSVDCFSSLTETGNDGEIGCLQWFNVFLVFFRFFLDEQ